MLDSLKKYASSWVAQILIGLLVLSFAVWGVSDIFSGFRGDAVAQVGSSDITVLEYQREYEIALQNLSRQLGVPITQQQATQMGIPGQVLGRLISQATLNEAAASLGLGMSNEMLGQQIAADPRFLGSDGTFNRGNVSEYIRQQRLTEDQFIINQRSEYIRGQIGQAFAGGVAAPETYLRAINEFRNEARDISYVVLVAPPDEEIAAPDDATLATWFNERTAEWQAPEYRAAAYFSLSPEAIARVEDVTDEEAQARYDANPQRFGTVERRHIEQILFDERAAADAAAEALAGGRSFDELLADRNLAPADVDLGMVTAAQLADPAVAGVAFDLAENAVSPVIDGRFGPVIVRVTEIEPAVVTSFAEAKDGLKKEIAAERAVAEINDLYDAIEDARAGGDAISEVAARYGLSASTIAAIDAKGLDEAGNAVPDVSPELLAALFETDVGLENNPIEPARNVFVWYEVTAITAPRDRSLDEVRDQVVTSWKEEQRKTRLEEHAGALVRELGSRPLPEVAAELLLVPKTANGLTRATAPSGDVTPAVINAVFSTDRGMSASTEGADPLTSIVFLVNTITVPTYADDAPGMDQARQQFDNQFVGDLLGMYVGELQSQTDVRFNQPVLELVLGSFSN